MKNIIIILFISAFLLPLQAQEPQEPQKIIQKSHDAVKVSSFEAISTLTITDSKGNVRTRKNTMASRVFADKTEKRIIKFIAPVEVKGTGILIVDYEAKSDDMWIYLPALGKTRRIVSKEKSNSFMGSEFSNANMTAPAIDDFTYELLGSEKIGESDCWKIASLPINANVEDEYGYSKSISFIGKNDYIVRQTNYFDYDKELFKTIKTLRFTTLDNKFMITEMTAENFENGRSSTMKMEKVQIADSKDEYFTVSYLER